MNYTFVIIPCSVPFPHGIVALVLNATHVTVLTGKPLLSV
jgi:hypothetical protein